VDDFTLTSLGSAPVPPGGGTDGGPPDGGGATDGGTDGGMPDGGGATDGGTDAGTPDGGGTPPQQNPIASENARPGDAWDIVQIGKPAQHEGYASPMSVPHGEGVEINNTAEEANRMPSHVYTRGDVRRTRAIGAQV